MKQIFLLTLLLLSLTSFYLINKINYVKARTIKLNIVKHPENLPTKEMAFNTSFGFKNLKADLYWLETIQYIWWNAVSSEYKKYLYLMLDVITELNPFFEHPYSIWQLLLPEYNPRYEKLEKNQQSKNIEQWINIWLKWIDNFCDKNKLEAIKNNELSYNFQELKTNNKFRNPCKTYKIPYNLAFIYFFYKKDPKTASYYYRVAYANDDTLEWARMMAAIMKWKWWERVKSFYMFLNMAQTDWTNEICTNFSQTLIDYSSNRQFVLDSTILKKIQNSRNQIFFNIKKDKQNKILDSTWCEHFLNKAIRELNLIYLESANKRFLKRFSKNALNAKQLLEKWMINFIPTDPQSKKDHIIKYYYNDEIKRFDYK